MGKVSAAVDVMMRHACTRSVRGVMSMVWCWLTEGSHESKAIPYLLEQLNLKETTVSIDAAGCQPALAQAIVEKGGNYVLALKKN